MNIIIIGAGPSGMMCAIKAKNENNNVTIIEKNDKAGKRATGKFIEAIADEEINQHYIVNSRLYGKYKDANEFLVADREGFIKKMSPFKK